MTDARELLRVQPDDPAYVAAAEAEAAFWRDVRPDSLESLEGRVADGITERYTNARFTDDPRVRWEETVCRWGRFRRGLALGTASLSLEGRILATNPELHLTFVDISDGPLERRRSALGARFPGRVEALAQDLNFASFGENAHDLIISSSTLHHVTNLEFLAHEINRALTPGGFFFLQDYVGEPRFQFAAGKKAAYESVFRRLAAREGRRGEVRWSTDDDLSPFCGVRSDEMLEVFAAQMELVHLRTAGALTIAMMRSQPAEPPRRVAGKVDWVARRIRRRAVRLFGRRANVDIDPEFFSELTLVSDVLADAGAINPGNAFAVYRKRTYPRR